MLITFEGLDGCGKSTQARLLVRRISEAGRPATLVREPGGTPLSEQIRALLLDPEGEVAPLSELLLFSAARHQLVVDVIRPALERGEVVVCDRFYDSTIAYQGGGRGVADADWLTAFSLRVTGGVKPDRTIYLDLDPADARRRGSPDEADRIESDDDRFFARVARAYDLLVRREPDRFLRLDGSGTIEALSEAIWADIEPRLGGGTGPERSGLSETALSHSPDPDPGSAPRD